MKGLDSGVRIPAGPAKAAGYDVLFRYLYNITPAEVADVRANGLSFSLIAEFDTLTWHPVAQSPNAGEGHGQAAARQARALGAPAGTIIWATADTWVPQGGYGNVAGYLDGFRRGLGEYRPGLYGGARLIRTMLDRGHCDAGWLSGAYSWDDGFPRAKAGACAAQLPNQTKVGGVTCDLNDIYAPLNGFWFPVIGATFPSPTPAAPAPAATQQETDMGVPAYKLPTDPTIWTTEVRDGHLWYVPVAGPDDLGDMLASGAVTAVRPLATDPKDGGNPAWDAPFTRAEQAGRVAR